METSPILLLNTSATILAGMLANPNIVFDERLEPLAIKTALCLMRSVKAEIALQELAIKLFGYLNAFKEREEVPITVSDTAFEYLWKLEMEGVIELGGHRRIGTYPDDGYETSVLASYDLVRLLVKLEHLPGIEAIRKALFTLYKQYTESEYTEGND